MLSTLDLLLIRDNSLVFNQDWSSSLPDDSLYKHTLTVIDLGLFIETFLVKALKEILS